MNWNHKLFFKINGLAGKNKFLDKFSIFGGRWLVYLLVIFYSISVLFINSTDDRFFVAGVSLIIFVLSWFTAWIMSLILGLIVREKRPFIKYVNQVKLSFKPLFENWKSFPSDHAMTAFVIFFLFLQLNIWLSLVILPLSLLVGWGRIFGGVHYPADILGGIIVAGLSVFITSFISLNLVFSLFTALGL